MTDPIIGSVDNGIVALADFPFLDGPTQITLVPQGGDFEFALTGRPPARLPVAGTINDAPYQAYATRKSMMVRTMLVVTVRALDG